jgi:hypothetical protein
MTINLFILAMTDPSISNPSLWISKDVPSNIATIISDYQIDSLSNLIIETTVINLIE